MKKQDNTNPLKKELDNLRMNTDRSTRVLGELKDKVDNLQEEFFTLLDFLKLEFRNQPSRVLQKVEECRAKITPKGSDDE